MVDLGLSFGGSYTSKITMPFAGESSTTINNKGMWLNAGILGKYPIELADFVTVFPVLGAEYELNLAYSDENGNDLLKGMSDDEKAGLNRVWIKGGVGADFDVTESIYIRPLVTFGWGLNSKVEEDFVKTAKDGGASSAGYFNGKFDLGIYAGFKF